MGNMCTAEQKEQFEQKVEDAVDAVKEVAEDVKETAEAAVEQAKEIAEDVKEKVEEKVEQAKEAVADAAEAVADAAADPQGTAQEAAEAVQERAAQAVAEVKEAAGEAAETVADTMTAAVAAATGTMKVEFDMGKGSMKTVDFTSKVLGFSPARSGGGCSCTSAAKAKVVVSKVQKGLQADKLGVKQGWEVKKINGKEVTGLAEATKLLEESSAGLAEA